MTGDEIALAAEALAGVPFRLHGRDPDTGLDCIGLLAVALDRAGARTAFPNGYSIRTGRWAGLDLFAENLGFKPAEGEVRPGDIALFRPSASQMHFAIAARRNGHWVEAHAGLRRVVIAPASEPFQALWRPSATER